MDALALINHYALETGNMASCVGILQGRLSSVIPYLEKKAAEGDLEAAYELKWLNRTMLVSEYIWKNRDQRRLGYDGAVEELKSQGVL